MLSQHDFFTPEECTKAYEIVHALRDHWVNRSGGIWPFFTLGACSYLDASKNDQEKYLQTSHRLNPILQSNFPLLYERLAECLAEILQMPVRYEEGFGLPGFYIFLGHKAFEKPLGSAHFDKQFQFLKWNHDKVDMENPISFTCAFVLPKSPSGINYWQISKKEARNLSPEALEKLISTKEKLFFPDALGKLILRKGFVLHQLAPVKGIQSDEERITLQGYGLICDGIMRLYW